MRTIALVLAVAFAGLAPVTASAADPTGTTVQVSLTADGTPTIDDSWTGAVSDDGRFVAFTSAAWNLVPGDTDFSDRDVFVRDTTLGTTELVNRQQDGQPFTSDCDLLSMSGDGRLVYFLVERGYTETYRLWVRDRTAAVTTSLARGISEGDVSADGRWLAYTILDGTLATLHLRNLVTNHDRIVAKTQAQYGAGPSVANTGDVAFSTTSKLLPGDADGLWDAYLWTRTSDALEVIPQTATGTHLLPAGGAVLTPDGEAAVFHASGWMRWTRADGPALIDDAPYNEFVPLTAAITPDARFVVYTKGEADEHGSTSIHLYDAQTLTIERVDVNDYGWATQDDTWTMFPAISPDGRFIAFTSDAPSLVPSYTGQYLDVFLRDRAAAPTAGALANLMIRTAGQPFWNGEDQIGLGADGTWTNVARGSTETVKLRVRNESPFAGGILVRGPGSTPRVKVRYFDGATDVTAAVVGGTFAPVLAPGAAVTLALRIHVPRDVRPRVDAVLTIRASSTAVPAWRDVMGLGVWIS